MMRRNLPVIILLIVIALPQVLLIFIPNSFYESFFSVVRPVIYLGILAYCALVFRKNHRIYSGKSTLMMVAVLGVVVYIAFTFFAGVFTNFGSNPMNTTALGIFRNVWQYFIIFVIREYARGKIMEHVGEKHKYAWLIIVTIVMTFATIDNIGSLLSLGGFLTLDWLFTVLLPRFAMSLWLTYSAMNGGMVANMVFMGCYQGVQLFSPVLPNIPQILDAIAVYCIAFVMFIIYDSVEWMAKREDGINVQYAKKRNWIWTVIPGVVLVVLLMFGWGIFPVRPVVVASGSMEPEFARGDVVFVERVDFSELKIGDILNYEKEGMSVIHRIIGVGQDHNSQRYFITKGDNNPTQDLMPVYSNQVLGRAVARTPLVGYPALLFQGL